MFDAYKVAIHLQLVNGVSAGLGLINAELGRMNKNVAGVQGGFNALHTKMQNIQKLGLIGGATAAAGYGMLSLFKVPLDQATQWERVMASMRQKGLGDAQIADANKFLRANDIYGISLLERAKIFNEAQGSFRESGMSGSSALEAAKTMTPVLAGFKLAMATLDKKSHAAAEGSFSNLNKIVELMGGLNDTKRASEIVTGVFKAVQSSGKMVTERDLKQFITMGGSAVSMLPARMIFGALEPQMGEFGGSTMGTGMNTAFRLLTGTQSKPSKLFVKEALRMGLWNKSSLVFNSQGGIKEYKGMPLRTDAANLMRTNTPEFAKMLMSTYATKGITSQSDRERENEILLGRTGAKIYNKIMLQLSVMEHSLDAFDKARGPGEVNKVEKNSIMQKSLELHKQWNDALLNFGLIAMPLAIKGIDLATGALTAFSKFSKDNPGIVKTLTVGFIGLGTAMLIGGSLTVLTASFKGLGLILQGAKLAGTLAGIGEGASALAGVSGLSVLGASLGTLAGGIGLLGGAVSGIAWLLDWVAPNTNAGAGRSKQNQLVFKGGPDTHPGMIFQRGGRGGAWVPDPENYGNEGNRSRFVPPPMSKSTEVHTHVHLDGKEVAKSVTKHQGRETQRPQSGSGRVDPSMTPPFAGAYR